MKPLSKSFGWLIHWWQLTNVQWLEQQNLFYKKKFDKKIVSLCKWWYENYDYHWKNANLLISTKRECGALFNSK